MDTPQAISFQMNPLILNPQALSVENLEGRFFPAAGTYQALSRPSSPMWPAGYWTRRRRKTFWRYGGSRRQPPHRGSISSAGAVEFEIPMDATFSLTCTPERAQTEFVGSHRRRVRLWSGRTVALPLAFDHSLLDQHTNHNRRNDRPVEGWYAATYSQLGSSCSPPDRAFGAGIQLHSNWHGLTEW